LLFGLLALQNGLIDQGALFTAFTAWARDGSRSLAHHLVALNHLDDARRAAVDAIAAVHVQALGGDVDASLAALSIGRSTCASLLRAGGPDIEPTLRQVGSAHLTEEDDPERTASVSLGLSTSNGQRFRIVRPHARGGLGEVFVAVDGELHREVALKQILEQHADDPFRRERFVAEAEITVALEHPGVVPVYGLGVDAAGRPYYAMRFIKGESLKAAIERFHEGASRELDLRKLLRRFLDVCNAVDYAHSRGVIHRDLKPANIIVGKYGETLVVDWGLAKSVGRADPSVGEQTIAPSASGSSETLPGSAVGTPAYMSPEQARGDLNRLGPRSDVYSLGATLYCLLTGKPPFEGDDAGAILNAVQEGRFPRPSQLDPTLDTALEAVCLRAMAPLPEDRYQTPRELADDLERWMGDEPVTAWKEPLSRRARRWARRHRTAVTAGAVALLAGLVGLSAVAAVQSKANADLLDANRRVEQRYLLAVEAIKTFHTGVSEDFLLKEGQFKELRDRFLKSAADFYGKLGALLGKETDVISRRALAQSNFELAELTRKVGRQENALAAHRAVLAAREALAAEPGADIGVKVDVGQSLTAVADLLQDTGKAQEALAIYCQSESLLAALSEVDLAARSGLADCRSSLGYLLSRTGRTDEALAVYRQARSDQEALAAVPGASNDSSRDLAVTIVQIGYLLAQTGKPSEAEVEQRTALAIQEKLAHDNPTVTEYRSSLSRYHTDLGAVLSTTGKLSEAEAECSKALEVLQKLADENPGVTSVHRDLADAHRYLGAVLVASGELSRAEVEIRMAMGIWQKLADANPAVTLFRRRLVESHHGLGEALWGMGSLNDAEAEFRTALAMQQKLVDANPADTSECDFLANVLIHLADLVRSLGRAGEAKELYDRAVSLEEPKVREDPANPLHRLFVVNAIRQRALALDDLGDPAGAAVDGRRALSLCEGLSLESVWVLSEAACCHATLAGLAGKAGSGVSVAEGEAEAARAMGSLRRAIAMGYRNAVELRIESALDSLRSREDFQLLMMDVAFPAEPFAT
jgi:serine/threonine-protein kinase